VKLYDFSVYAKKREVQLSAARVLALKERLHEPGIVLELKREVQDWLVLHQEVSHKAS
jgi:hypothetical protein